MIKQKISKTFFPVFQRIPWAGLNPWWYFISSDEVWIFSSSSNLTNEQSASGWRQQHLHRLFSYSPLHFLDFSFIRSERNGSAICSAFGLWSSSFMWIFESKSDLGKMILEFNNFEYWVLFNVMRFVVHLFENSQNNRKLFNQKPISGALKRGQTIRNSDYRIWSRTIRFVILWKNVRKLYLFM